MSTRKAAAPQRTARTARTARSKVAAPTKATKAAPKAEPIAEGWRLEPQLKKVVDDFLARLKPKAMPKLDLERFKMGKLDLSKFRIEAKAFDRAAMRQRFEQHMADSLHRLGLPTHKEVQALARKVEQLAEQQG